MLWCPPFCSAPKYCEGPGTPLAGSRPPGPFLERAETHTFLARGPGTGLARACCDRCPRPLLGKCQRRPVPGACAQRPSARWSRSGTRSDLQRRPVPGPPPRNVPGPALASARAPSSAVGTVRCRRRPQCRGPCARCSADGLPVVHLHGVGSARGALYQIRTGTGNLVRRRRSRSGDKSSEPRLNLSRSWQQGHSAAYSTAFEPSRLQGIYPSERVELPCAGPEGPTGYAPGPARSRPIVSRVTVAGMT